MQLNEGKKFAILYLVGDNRFPRGMDKSKNSKSKRKTKSITKTNSNTKSNIKTLNSTKQIHYK